MRILLAVESRYQSLVAFEPACKDLSSFEQWQSHGLERWSLPTAKLEDCEDGFLLQVARQSPILPAGSGASHYLPVSPALPLLACHFSRRNDGVAQQQTQPLALPGRYSSSTAKTPGVPGSRPPANISGRRRLTCVSLNAWPLMPPTNEVAHESHQEPPSE